MSYTTRELGFVRNFVTKNERYPRMKDKSGDIWELNSNNERRNTSGSTNENES